MQRTVLKRGERKKGPLIAYDFETTRIPTTADAPMRVQPLYLTAHGAQGSLVSTALDRSMERAAQVLESEFLCDERREARYVAWNGNRFDVRIVLDAIVEHLPHLCVNPYWAGQAGLRGAMVYDRRNEKRRWYFLDGIAMTGLAGMKLAKFLALFAPDYAKLALDFEHVEFDPEDPAHIAYAQRDSEGLYHAMVRVDEILRDLTGRGLQVTIGNAGIKFFQSQMPDGAQAWAPPRDLAETLERHARRGGYVFTAKKYAGPLWSLDVNQAYAAAMRETDLPCGYVAATRSFSQTQPGLYVVRIARVPRRGHPFYCRRYAPGVAGDGEPVECYGEPMTTVVTSDEYRYLVRDGWTVSIERGWAWMGSFRMTAMADRLEALRSTCEGGPSGPIGTMVKAIGNNAYGKTGERIPPESYAFSAVQPSENHHRLAPHDPLLDYFWFEVCDPDSRRRRYHRPQIAAFITAAVRVKLMAAIDAAPRAFVKADTDSVSFSQPVDHLPISPTRYGAWKVECEGAPAIVVGKKCYALRDGGEWKFVVKGLRTREMALPEMVRWFIADAPPVQEQIQAIGLKSGIGAGSPMYRAQVRRGTNFGALASVQKRDEVRAWWEGAA